MSTELRNDGAFVPVDADTEISSPGRLGTADAAGLAPHEDTGLRGALSVAAARLGGTAHREIVVATEQVAPAADPTRVLRSSDGGDDLLLRHAHRPDQLPIVLEVDEAGMMSWHLPEPRPAAEHRAAGTSVFRLRGTAPPMAPQDDDVAHRGFLGTIGRKLVEIIVVPVVAQAAGNVLAAGIRAWESSARPHRLRTFRLDELDSDGEDVDAAEVFAQWGGERGLLLVHGTFNRTPDSFSSMGRPFLQQIDEHYGGRILAFDHPTVSYSPTENADWLARSLGSVMPSVDILATSRGGLVARSLEATGAVDLHRLVFSASPNGGTPLADSEHMGKLIDAVTNVIGLVPDNPITDTAEVIITVLRHVAAGTVDALDGLAAMRPGNRWLEDLNRRPLAAGSRFLTSDYEPSATVAAWAKDTVMDAVFGGQPNDLVVPTASVVGPWTGKVPDDHRLRFGPDDSVTHGAFVGHADVQAQLLEWLR